MTDIVKRLRVMGDDEMCDEAADEIERLRASLKLTKEALDEAVKWRKDLLTEIERRARPTWDKT